MRTRTASPIDSAAEKSVCHFVAEESACGPTATEAGVFNPATRNWRLLPEYPATKKRVGSAVASLARTAGPSDGEAIGTVGNSSDPSPFTTGVRVLRSHCARALPNRLVRRCQADCAAGDVSPCDLRMVQ